jgi:hypothetical protein
MLQGKTISHNADPSDDAEDIKTTVPATEQVLRYAGKQLGGARKTHITMLWLRHMQLPVHGVGASGCDVSGGGAILRQQHVPLRDHNCGDNSDGGSIGNSNAHDTNIKLIKKQFPSVALWAAMQSELQLTAWKDVNNCLVATEAAAPWAAMHSVLHPPAWEDIDKPLAVADFTKHTMKLAGQA